MMDMRQHSSGALSISLPHSSQAAMTNENYFLFDPNQSPSSSMDLGGFSSSLSSYVNSDFCSSFLESTSQNSLALNMDLGIDGTPTPNGFLLPADEWSGTTNSAPGAQNSQQQQGKHSSSPNQGQSSLSQGSLTQSVLLDTQKPCQRGYGGCQGAASHNAPELFGAHQAHVGKVQNQEGESGIVKQPSSRLLEGETQQAPLENQGQSSDLQGGYMCQQSLSWSAAAANAMELSSQDPSFQEVQTSSLPLGFENSQAFSQQATFEGVQKPGFQSGMQGHHHDSVFQSLEADSSLVKYQMPNQPAFFQRRQIPNQVLKTAGPQVPHQSGMQIDQGMQAIRGLGLQLQGKMPQTSLQAQMHQGTSLQAQMSSQYLNFSGQAAAAGHSNMAAHQSLLQVQAAPDQLNPLQTQPNNHPLSILLQPQSSTQIQTLTQICTQAQPANQQTATSQQYQAQLLKSAAQHTLFNANQQNPSLAGQSQMNQTHPLASSYGLQLNEPQNMLAQLQPRLLNPILQGLKVAGCQMFQGSASTNTSYSGSGEGSDRSAMPGTIASRCIQILMLYIQEQRKRPVDNDILFWRNLVRDFFVPGAITRWCLSSYNSSPMGHHAQGLFPMEYWFCNLCGVQPGRGFESSTDVLPRLFKIKYDSGLVDELLFLDTAEEKYMLPSGKLVLEFPRAVHESIFQELRVVRYGRLRVTFNSSFKIYSWEFCTKIHEEVVPRKNLLQQAQQLASLVMEADQEGFNKNAEDLNSHCNEFTSMARQLALQLEAPNVNDLGFSKRYVRCLQIAEVVNIMKDLVSFERKIGLGPVESLTRFPTARKLQSEGLFSGFSTLTQMINQLTQGTSSANSSQSHLLPCPSVPKMQEQVSSHPQSTLLHGSVSAVSKLSQSVNQFPTQVRSQIDARTNSFLHQQMNSQMQQTTGQAYLQTCNQLLTQNSTQSVSSLQGQHISQAQSHLCSQLSGHQQMMFNHLGQQIYESAGMKLVHPPTNQVLSHSQSLHQTGQQSLPGTPQSEMSDMRSNA